MKLALDTNRYSDFSRDVPDVLSLLRRATSIAMPFVTIAELRAGFAAGSRPAQNERLLSQWLASPRVYPLFPDDETTQIYAALFQQLRQQGTPIPTNDIWIAALTVQHGLTLYARDKHFDQLPQVPRI